MITRCPPDPGNGGSQARPPVLVAEDGLAAWALYQREAGTINVLISDWTMPGLDGVAFCRRIRALW
jgi:CheY-like chemotaxis protein